MKSNNFDFVKALKFIVVCACAVLLMTGLALNIFAQSENPTNPTWPVYKTGTVSLTGIGTTAGGATTTVTNGWIDVRGMQSVTLGTTFNFASATTSNVVYTIYKSIDKSNVETTGGTTWTVAGNGTTPVVATTEITVGSAGWLKLATIQNTHASIVLTNSSFIYGIKRNSP